MPNCKQCASAFPIRDDDLAFYEKISPVFNGKKELIPAPTLCPSCRMQRRLAWRNEKKLYHRKCDMTGKQIISIYAPEKPLPVYASDVWWSDKWDPTAFGRSFDESLSFFEQFRKLQSVVPQIALFSRENENSDYTNHVYQMKNCYLVTTAVSCEDCYYGDWVIKSANCVDCSHVTDCVRCYESSYCETCTNCAYLSECHRCSDSRFLFDCRDCSNCLFCWNLRQKEFHIYNKRVSKEEFAEALKTLRDISTVHAASEAFQKMCLDQAIRPSCRSVQTEDSSGDHLIECRNARECFDVHRAHDTKNVCDAIDIVDSVDCNYTAFHCALNYETHACDGSQNVLFSTRCYDSQHLLYCDLCHNSSHLFGCIGLRQKHYCILNRQYTKEEYEVLVPKLIAHMRNDGDDTMNPISWGEYFPIHVSPFSYNETVAQDYFPLGKSDVLARGWHWFEEATEHTQYMGPLVAVPTSIDSVQDLICSQILTCEASQKPYKIIPQELKFYRSMGIPLPRRCPDERHKDRIALRNPRKLWNRQCAKCSSEIQTTYAPERPEIVYCEKCYLESVY